MSWSRSSSYCEEDWKKNFDSNSNSEYSRTTYWVTCKFCHNQMPEFALNKHVKRQHIAIKCKLCNNWMPERSIERHMWQKHSSQSGREPNRELEALIKHILRRETARNTKPSSFI